VSVSVRRSAAEHRAAVSTFALAFKAATGAVRRLRGRESHHPGELSYAQFGLLFGLADRGECSASELAGLADVAPATATQMLDHLDAEGLVERVRSERDRRIVLVSLTPRGRELVAARRARYEALWARELADFSVEELGVATAVLARTAAIFAAIAAQSDEDLQAAAGPTPAA
jgi:DNA-binding MarR family transcriptional regulator